MSANSILINIGAKTKQAVDEINAVNRALGDTMTSSEKTSAALGKMAGPAKAALAGIGLAAAAGVKAASDQQQAFGALDSVYGKNAASMQKWAAAQAGIGLSSAEAAQAAALLGSQLQNAGASSAEAAAQSQKLVGLGADLAATYGGPASDAVDALSAAFKGEFDSMEKYGVSIKASDVATRLAAQGQDKLTGEAKKAAEAAAIQALITEQTTAAQGQAAREADSFAGQTAALTATLKNMGAQLAAVLLPLVSQLVGWLKQVATWAKNNATTVRALIAVIAGLAAGILIANLAMKAYQAAQTAMTVATKITTGAIKAMRTAQLLLNLAMYANPIGLVVAAILALGVAFVVAYKKSETFRNIVNGVFRSIKAVAESVFGAIEGAIQGAINKLRGLWDWLSNIGDKLHGVLSKIPGVGKAAASAGVTSFDSPTMATATRSSARAASPATSGRVVVTEEQVYRAVSRLIMRGDGRNGLAVGVI